MTLLRRTASLDLFNLAFQSPKQLNYITYLRVRHHPYGTNGLLLVPHMLFLNLAVLGKSLTAFHAKLCGKALSTAANLSVKSVFLQQPQFLHRQSGTCFHAKDGIAEGHER
jgi:hypothetical protein